MISRCQVVSVVGLVLVMGASALMVVRLSAQGAQPERVDFTSAVTAEVRNAQGQVVLSGQFNMTEQDGDEIERKAQLTATGVDTDASGEAEVEVSGSGGDRRQEVEFAVMNVQPGGVFTLVIDGRDVATITADNRGRAEDERDIPLPPASTSERRQP